MKKYILWLIILLFFTSCSQENNKENNLVDEVLEQQNIVIDKNDNREEKIIEIDAKKWEYSNREIHVKKWDKVIIKINNTDVLHGIAIPQMKLKGDDEIEVDTSVSWEFEFRCANYCWSGHQEMTWKLIIE